MADGESVDFAVSGASFGWLTTAALFVRRGLKAAALGAFNVVDR